MNGYLILALLSFFLHITMHGKPKPEFSPHSQSSYTTHFITSALFGSAHAYALKKVPETTKSKALTSSAFIFGNTAFVHHVDSTVFTDKRNTKHMHPFDIFFGASGHMAGYAATQYLLTKVKQPTSYQQNRSKMGYIGTLYDSENPAYKKTYGFNIPGILLMILLR